MGDGDASRHLEAALAAAKLCEPEDSLIRSGLVVRLAFAEAARNKSKGEAKSGGGVLPKLEAGLQSMMKRHFGGKSQHIYEKAKHTQTLDLSRIPRPSGNSMTPGLAFVRS